MFVWMWTVLSLDVGAYVHLYTAYTCMQREYCIDETKWEGEELCTVKRIGYQNNTEERDIFLKLLSARDTS